MTGESTDSNRAVSLEIDEDASHAIRHDVIEITDKILCPYCLRSSSNGKRCIGRCVADDDY
tara:strand:+ start:271 stop:453 length:183 start_codon:yes stop_codon:yes gene_type:complete